MKAAIVTEAGKTPVYGDFPNPAPAANTHLVTVTASALSHVTRSRASGAHYSSTGQLPFVPGVDGTGLLEDGRRVYFLLPEAPYGGMGEQTLVPVSRCLVLPDGLDAVTAAAMANPGMSSWAALKERARFAQGETVLINGATSTSGRLAVQVAKYLGAKKVIATGRNPATLASLAALGANATISLTQDKDALEDEFQTHFAEGVNVVLDYLWGESAETLLVAAAKAAPEAVPICFVGIGSASSPTITLPSAALRSSALELMGSGVNSIPLPRLVKAVEELLAAAASGAFEMALKTVPLAHVADHWSDLDSASRTVFTTGLEAS
jgi:NADPH:quinone reductase-like Zn-dependent oxidoreductase